MKLINTLDISRYNHSAFMVSIQPLFFARRYIVATKISVIIGMLENYRRFRLYLFDHHSVSVIMRIMVIVIVLNSSQTYAESYQSAKATVIYENKKDLTRFAELVRPGGVMEVMQNILIKKGSQPQTFAEFLDSLFTRVQLILDMPLPKIKVNIYIHESQKTLYKEFLKVSGGANQRQKELGVTTDLPSFYQKDNNTIHVQIEKYNVGMLAHEMAHCVTSHFFIIQPPTTVSELMSQHVDRIITTERF